MPGRWLWMCCVLVCRAARTEELEAQELESLRVSLLQSSFSRSRRSPDDKEQRFAFDEVRKAWYIHEIKERLDLGDVKEDLLTQLSSLQQQCPDAEEIQAQMSDFWEEVGRWVKVEDLRRAMDREAWTLHQEKARMDLDIEGSNKKLKELEWSYANATKNFTKDQEGRFFEIVNIDQRLQELKKLIAAAVHSDDAHALQEEFDLLQKTFKDLTKDLNDSQLQQSFHVVELKGQIDAIKKTLTNERIQSELRERLRIPESRYHALQRQLDNARKAVDMDAVEKQIMAVWSKSLHDLPDMAEQRNAFAKSEAERTRIGA